MHKFLKIRMNAWILAASLSCIGPIGDSSLAHAQPTTPPSEVDVLLIGGGIMSATLGTLLKELNPRLRIALYEKLDVFAGESTDAFNNAGTGHSALCELNYTPELADGSIEISKAIETMEAYEVSKQFWASLVARGALGDPRTFIHSVPHVSWVHGRENVDYLRKRAAALGQRSLFKSLEYSEDPAVLAQWMPVMMSGRALTEPMAATRSLLGTDVDFGTLTRQLIDHLGKQDKVTLAASHEIRDLKQNTDRTWLVSVRNLLSQKDFAVKTKFVFIGAGGGSLPLLQRSGIPEAKGYGGFPISGQFLLSNNPQLAELQDAKVYGRAAVGAPPMSVPHLDTRVIDGKKRLIFGPFAGATTRFLKHGSMLDLWWSIQPDNAVAIAKAGAQNLPLLGYLMNQVSQGSEERLDALREFVPNAEAKDWELLTAGQRVQIIKETPGRGSSVLRFGTEVVSSQDGSLAALLGASPGASTSVDVMLKVLGRNFSQEMQSASWQARLRTLIPSYGQTLAARPQIAHSLRKWSHQLLKLESPESCSEALQ